MRILVLFLCLSAAALAQSFPHGKNLGNPQAPVRIELFSDYECPACKLFHEQTLKPVIKSYVDTGKVYIVHREFPLTQIHQHALTAARVASAAEQMGKYELICDQLFRTQESWTKSGDVLGAACGVLGPADAKKLRELAASPQVAQAVDADIRAGQSEKVGGTPTMIISKMIRRFPVNGPVSYEVLSRFIDSLLK